MVKSSKSIDQKFYDSLTFNCHDNLIELTNDQKKKTLEIISINSSNNLIIHSMYMFFVEGAQQVSGKTFVYFEALKNVLVKGFQGLILLPEIGLTTQFEKNL